MLTQPVWLKQVLGRPQCRAGSSNPADEKSFPRQGLVRMVVDAGLGGGIHAVPP